MERSSRIEKAVEASKEKRWLDVESAALEALSEEPNSVEALRLLAQALSQTARQAQAADALKFLLELSPLDRDARMSLASLSWHLKLFQQCADQCISLLDTEPDNSHLWNSLGLCYVALELNEDAICCLEKASVLRPDVLTFKQNLARAFEKDQKPRLAVEAYRQALMLDPGSVECLYGLAKLSFALGDAEEAQECIDGLARIRPLTTEERLLRCEILLLSERAEEALVEAGRIIELNPGHAGAYLIRAVSLQQKGRHEESVDALLTAIGIDPDFPKPYLHLAQSKRFAERDQAIVSRMVDLASRTDRHPADIARMHFALGKVFDDLKDYERAMNSFDEGHRILRVVERTEFDPEEMRRTIDGLIATFTTGFFERSKRWGLETDMPVFIVGLQRSGTTLTETILSSHHKVRAGGEISFWAYEAPKILRIDTHSIDPESAVEVAGRYLLKLSGMADGAERVTDKLPANFQYVGLLHAMYPNARFVHCRRHPVDNCLSFYMNMLTGTSFVHDKAHIVYAYRQYARLMMHWRSVILHDRLFEVDYEELITDQEAVTRRLIDFCGLKWEESCLHPERNDRIISTASHWQARQPLYQSSLERWRRYEPWLGEFRELLESPPS